MNCPYCKQLFECDVSDDVIVFRCGTVRKGKSYRRSPECIGTPTTPSATPSRYSWEIKGVPFDFYRLCEIIGVKHHAQARALKKVIRAGRGDKLVIHDIDEAIASLKRWKEMILEDRTP